ncbi:hypothetical protein A1O7_09782 [Cladophialophora yegresii CBS 114405]|uniref:Acyl-coenzyme A oxidase n=1 Tax=Cladophialophora yegresii CBS 114405 TaxID=1182544 RepID=W9VG48_9EURO|nr:uncharacterized protein A1O7_09782 [Cladophialophora yegresii CBS 114405]EXJ54443.1 hypothetical protein A1O7_09782 [Cladophialophora yegresii CBS 114405]
MAFNHQKTLMAQARARGTFDTEALAQIIHGGAEGLQQKRGAWSRVEEAVGATDPDRLPDQYAYTSREDLYREGLQTGKAAWIDGVKHGHSLFDVITPRYGMSNASPFGIHYNLFGRTIDLMGTPEQKRKWMPLVAQGRVNGAYIQTELGHGSNVAGIQTTATFDPVDDAIVLHTPQLAAIKYWPGSIGYSATHGVVMARLLVPTPAGTAAGKPFKDHGIHPFLVQLRDPETGQATPGLELGDIGLKPAYNQNDNGYLSFDHFKIPRTDMLMGHCALDSDGKFTRYLPPEAVYGTMLSSRTFITFGAAFQLAYALTIAIRYSVVREQGSLPFDNQGKASQDIPIIAYRSQQYRLFSLLSSAYAMSFASKITRKIQDDLDARLRKGDYSTVTHAHGLMAGAKAWFTTVAADGAEDARKCCGGHGYLNISGLPDIVNMVTACCTLEGDNMVMWQQTARYLMKVMDVFESVQPRTSQVPPEIAYLANDPAILCATPIDPASLKDLHHLSAIRAHYHVKTAHNALTEAVKEGTPKPQAWNLHMLLLIRAAHAHISHFVLSSFYSALPTISDAKIKPVLTQLCHLFALTQLFPQLPTSSPTTASLPPAFLYPRFEVIASQQTNALLEAILPNAIALTDAWDFTDASLASALGCKDGNVYERLMSWTRQLPINARAKEPGGFDTRESWERYIKPALRIDLERGTGRRAADERFGEGIRARL